MAGRGGNPNPKDDVDASNRGGNGGNMGGAIP